MPTGRRARRRSRSWPTSAGSPIRRARAAASAPPGLEAAGAYIEARFKRARPRARRATRRLPPAIPGAHRRQGRAGDRAAARRRGRSARDASSRSASRPAARRRGPLVLAGYGIVDKALDIDDYARLDVKGKIVVVRRFVPEHPALCDARAPAPRRRPAPEGLARARARRARARRRRLARRVPKDAPRRTGSRPREPPLLARRAPSGLRRRRASRS